MRSRTTLKTVSKTPILQNSVRGEDTQFDQCWEDTVHGRATREPDEYEPIEARDQTNIQVNASGGPEFDKSAKP